MTTIESVVAGLEYSDFFAMWENGVEGDTEVMAAATDAGYDAAMIERVVRDWAVRVAQRHIERREITEAWELLSVGMTSDEAWSTMREWS